MRLPLHISNLSTSLMLSLFYGALTIWKLLYSSQCLLCLVLQAFDTGESYRLYVKRNYVGCGYV